MFRTAKDHRSFITILLTYALDLVGFSIVFPVLAPLLLNPELAFFAKGVSLETKTTVLGLLYASFGVAQFIGAPLIGAIADHFGRKKAFLGTIGLSIFGYLIIAFSLYSQDLFLLFFGRLLTGLSSGNFPLAQSATADLTEPKFRSKAFGILIGVGGFGFIAGPWVGGKLANPEWLYGSGAFIFAAVAALINFILVFTCYHETSTHQMKDKGESLWHTFSDLKIVFQEKPLRILLTSQLIFSLGWAFLLVFAPTFLVQKFQMSSSTIGDIYAYQSVCWGFVSIVLNRVLVDFVSLRFLILVGLVTASIGSALFVAPSQLWPYWFIVPISMFGGALSWVNIGSLLSLKASSSMQGRALGSNGAMWSIGQIVAPLIAGPLSGWNMHAPILLGAVFLLLAFIYFFVSETK